MRMIALLAPAWSAVPGFVAGGAYRDQPSFRRFVQARANPLRVRGIEPDLME
jgi:hypothetical protein